MKKRFVYLFILLILISFVFAHEDEEGLEDIKEDIIEPNEGTFRDFLPVPFIITIFIPEFEISNLICHLSNYLF